MGIKKFLFKCSETNTSDYGLLVARLMLGFFMFFHGAQKVMGWFDGPGLEGALGFLGSLGVPVFIIYLVAFGEFLGGIAMILGFRVRPVAAAFIIILLGAIGLVHFENGFADYEKHLLAIAISISLLINGGGALALDTKVKKLFK